MDLNNATEKNLLNILKEATGHPSIQPIDLGLSGRVLVDHIIGRFEQAIHNQGGPEYCHPIIRDGYGALKQLYPLYFRNTNTGGESTYI